MRLPPTKPIPLVIAEGQWAARTNPYANEMIDNGGKVLPETAITVGDAIESAVTELEILDAWRNAEQAGLATWDGDDWLWEGSRQAGGRRLIR